jgi:Zn-dependent protease
MFIATLFDDPLFFIRIVILVIFSITIHELAHGWAAMSQGDNTPQRLGHLTWNPVVHMGVESLIFLVLTGISWGQMPVNPSRFRNPKWGSIFVSTAGPLSNLCLALIFVLLLQIKFNVELTSFLSTKFLYMGAAINIRQFLFNMLPVPPLDGFHIFSEFFPEFKFLNNSNVGIFALMLLSFSGFSLGLSFVGETIIHAFIPNLAIN